MKSEIITSSGKYTLSNIFKRSILAGLGGYILFLGILIATKMVSMFIQPKGSLGFETADFILPIIGFLLLFLIKFLEHYKED